MAAKIHVTDLKELNESLRVVHLKEKLSHV